MPELPEIEGFRSLLQPFQNKKLHFERVEREGSNPPKTMLSHEDASALSGNCVAKDVLRKGKLLCVVLECTKKVHGKKRLYLFMHMMMTGRISSPSMRDTMPKGYLNNIDQYPPTHTHLRIYSEDGEEISFSDSRKFGSVLLATSMDFGFDQLATDGLCIPENMELLVPMLAEQGKGVKAILLDQRCVVSGVGNWVADEVLYQCRIHPDQTNMTVDDATRLLSTLYAIFQTGVSCVLSNKAFPGDWIFHCRWSKSKATIIKDPAGRTVKFVTSGGRTSAIVPSIQKKVARGNGSKGTRSPRKASKRKSTETTKEAKYGRTKIPRRTKRSVSDS